MKGGELRRFREEQGWSQDELGRLLKGALGKGSGTTVGKWEKEQRPVPDDVAAFVAQLQLDAAMGEPPLDEEALGLGPEPAPVGFGSPPVEGSEGDTAPPEPGDRTQPPAAQLPLSGGSTYGKVCTELWELVATGIGMVGAGIGSDTLRRDGEIILADAPALGRAWGKLAETNDTFRRMLLGATSGGAWLEVGLVTGGTTAKLWRAHQEAAEQQRLERARQVAEWQAEHPQQAPGEVTDYGYQEPAAA